MARSNSGGTFRRIIREVPADTRDVILANSLRRYERSKCRRHHRRLREDHHAADRAIESVYDVKRRAYVELLVRECDERIMSVSSCVNGPREGLHEREPLAVSVYYVQRRIADGVFVSVRGVRDDVAGANRLIPVSARSVHRKSAAGERALVVRFIKRSELGGDGADASTNPTRFGRARKCKVIRSDEAPAVDDVVVRWRHRRINDVVGCIVVYCSRRCEQCVCSIGARSKFTTSLGGLSAPATYCISRRAHLRLVLSNRANVEPM